MANFGKFKSIKREEARKTKRNVEERERERERERNKKKDQ